MNMHGSRLKVSLSAVSTSENLQPETAFSVLKGGAFAAAGLDTVDTPGDKDQYYQGWPLRIPNFWRDL